MGNRSSVKCRYAFLFTIYHWKSKSNQLTPQTHPKSEPNAGVLIVIVDFGGDVVYHNAIPVKQKPM